MWKGDPYLDPQTEILYNRHGLKTQASLDAVELLLTADAFEQLIKEPLPGGFDQKHLQAIHRRLFEKVYFKAGEHSPAFAGEVRVIGIEKDAGIDYPHPDHPVESLKARLDYAFDQLGRDKSLSNDTAQSKPTLFAERLAHHAAELWECHPFRDGNTRTTLLFAEHLARHHGVELLRGAMNVGAFRTSIADYARGERQNFLDLMKRMVVDGLGIARKPSEVEKIVPEKAEQLLSVEAASILESLQQRQREELSRLEVIRDRARQALDEREGELSQGGRADKLELQRLKEAYLLANRDVKRLDAQWQARSEYRAFEVMKIARQQHPEAARVIEDVKTRAEARELSGRWRSLEQKIQGLTLQGGHESAINYRRELSDLLSRVDRNRAVKAALPKAMRDRVTSVRQENERAIGQALERGPSRER